MIEIQVGQVLSQIQLEAQLNFVELLLCMYSGDDEITLTQDSEECFNLLKNELDQGLHMSTRTFSKIVLHLKVPLVRSTRTDYFTLQIDVPLVHQIGDHPTAPLLSIARPTFLNKRQFDTLQADIPSGEPDCVQEAIEYLQDVCIPDDMNITGIPIVKETSDEVVRAWFYFPSLSTREKRNDLVLLAPDYGLTGFVLAGKPGVLCIEGTATNIQAYVADIKRNSWGDIPSFQKKITERFRESHIPHRKFADMREITDDIERHGQRGNRGDLAQVEKFLAENELGNAFAIVFMQKT